MIIRTVLDLRPNLPKFVLQTLLLAASWHQFARKTARLEVLHIGELPRDLATMFDRLGVIAIETLPNPNDDFSKTSNTIQGAGPETGQQILLIDNDVVFTGPIDDLGALPIDCVYGAVAGTFRVTDKQWARIGKLGFSPASCSGQIPRAALVAALATGKHRPPPLAFGYANGGVILFPPGYDFQSTWQMQQRAIADAFKGSRLKSSSVKQSNMAALATTIGSYGKFDWLPPGYNFRHADFALGLCPASEIRLVHMTGLGNRASAATLSGWIDEYWSAKMTKGLIAMRPVLEPAEFDQRFAQLSAIHDTIFATISAYELDRLTAPLADQVLENTAGTPTT